MAGRVPETTDSSGWPHPWSGGVDGDELARLASRGFTALAALQGSHLGLDDVLSEETIGSVGTSSASVLSNVGRRSETAASAKIAIERLATLEGGLSARNELAKDRSTARGRGLERLVNCSEWLEDNPRRSSFGLADGECVTVTDLRVWNSETLELLVLSSCESPGKGGPAFDEFDKPGGCDLRLKRLSGGRHFLGCPARGGSGILRSVYRHWGLSTRTPDVAEAARCATRAVCAGIDSQGVPLEHPVGGPFVLVGINGGRNVAVSDDDWYQTLYAEAIRQLGTQENDFSQLCSRASYLLAAVTLSTSFLGGSLVRTKQLAGADWGAIAAFLVALGLCAWMVASPLRGWNMGFDPKLAYERYLLELDPPLTRDEFYVEMLYQTDQAYAENKQKLGIRRTALLLAAAALAVEITLWLVDLGLTKVVTK
jgi:hypothetical protein